MMLKQYVSIKKKINSIFSPPFESMERTPKQSWDETEMINK